MAALFACLYVPPAGDPPAAPLTDIAADFSPRYERHGGDRIVIDVRGLERLLGRPHAIAEEMRREAAARGVRVHVALARTWTTALLIALTRPGVTIVEAGREAAALSAVRLDIVPTLGGDTTLNLPPGPASGMTATTRVVPGGACAVLKRWGLRTLGEVAALPPAALAARLGAAGSLLHALARGVDSRPLVPDVPDERFESSLALEWPIEELEPLSFVLTRLLEPLSTRLERRDRGVAVLHVRLRLVTRDVHARRLELPSPIRDVRTLRTLALLDLETHPPTGGVDGVEIIVEPTPGRVLQHTLFRRAHPTPEQLSTLLARLGALIGQDRIGAPATIDSYRPDGFAMVPFRTRHDDVRGDPPGEVGTVTLSAGGAAAPADVTSALRRCRPPVPARVAVEGGRPVRVTTDRQGLPGGAVRASAGPWRTSGDWWAGGAGGSAWHRDEWDVAVADGAVYRVFQDRDTDRWFIDGIVD